MPVNWHRDGFLRVNKRALKADRMTPASLTHHQGCVNSPVPRVWFCRWTAKLCLQKSSKFLSRDAERLVACALRLVALRAFNPLGQ
jgi:hypothetical protein